MSAHHLMQVLLVALVLVVAVSVAASADGKVSPRSVVDGVLSALGAVVPAADSEESAETSTETATADQASGKNGERGIHKKKILYHTLWASLYWWAWAFAVVAVKFKIALLLIWGHLSYFVAAFIRMLIREVPLWVQLKGPIYGPPPPQYGPPVPPSYGPQYAASAHSPSYAHAPGPYKRRTGGAATAGAAEASSGSELAYGAHSRRK